MTISIRWLLGSSLLVTGGFTTAVLLFIHVGLEGERFQDMVWFVGALFGGAVAAGASQRRAIGEVGLGALLALAVALLGVFMFARAEFTSAIEAGSASKIIRSAALFTIGATVGAALGGKLFPRRLTSGWFWGLAGAFTTIAFMFLVAGVGLQLTQSSVALGLVLIFLAPSLGVLSAWAMCPIDRAVWIACGAMVPPTAAVFLGAESINVATFVGCAVLAGPPALACKLAKRLWPRDDELPTEVPSAGVVSD